jgi:hypothetical protein
MPQDVSLGWTGPHANADGQSSKPNPILLDTRAVPYNQRIYLHSKLGLFANLDSSDSLFLVKESVVDIGPELPEDECRSVQVDVC